MKTINYCIRTIGLTAWTLFAFTGNAAAGPWYADPRVGAVGFSIGEKGYMGTGCEYFRNAPIFQKDFWEYDPHSDTWTQKADFAGTARYFAVGFSIGAKGYIGTGKTCDGPVFGLRKDFWEYDPTENIWTQKADIPGPDRSAAVGFSLQNKGYIGTGHGVADLRDFWEYDPAADSWIRIADLPGNERHGAVGFSIGSKGYCGTGQHSVLTADPTYYGDFYEYDPNNDSWTKKTTFGGMPRASAVGFSIEEKGYIGTGVGSDGFTKDFWEYDPVNDTWSRKADFGGIRRRSAAGFSIGYDKGYIGIGIVQINQHFQDFWEYCRSRDLWIRKADFGGKDYDRSGPARGTVSGIDAEAEGVLKTDAVNNMIDHDDSPLTMGIGQNYPNPFSSSTTIPCKIMDPSDPYLVVMNIMGEVVRLLELPTNVAEITWDGRDDSGKSLPPGTYYYGFPRSGSDEFKKMVILR